MSEQTMRHRVIRGLKPLDAKPVENPVGPGTPDVNCICGWIELKWMRRWPRLGGVVRIDHFTPQQRNWLRRRWEKGGGAWLLLQVGQEYLLFEGPTAAEHVGMVNRTRLRQLAVKIWDRGMKFKELELCLTNWANLPPGSASSLPEGETD